MSSEQQAKQLKQFYHNLIRYIMMSAGYILIWILTGGGYFWPIWPIIVEGLFILKQAQNAGLIENIHKYKKNILSVEEKWVAERVKKDIENKAPTTDQASDTSINNANTETKNNTNATE